MEDFILNVILYIIAALLTFNNADSQSTFQTLLPGNKSYIFHLNSNVTTCIDDDCTDCMLEAKLTVQPVHESNRTQFQMEDLMTFINIKNAEPPDEQIEHVPHLEYLKEPWEVDVCFLNLHTVPEPVWVTNIKREISFSFLFTEPNSNYSTYHNDEPCLYGTCMVVYSKLGWKTKKYTTLLDSTRKKLSTYEKNCLPKGYFDNWYKPIKPVKTTYTLSGEWLYEVNEKGLKNLKLESTHKQKIHDYIDVVITTTFLLHHESEKPRELLKQLDLKETNLQYETESLDDPLNLIWNPTVRMLRKNANVKGHVTPENSFFVTKVNTIEDNNGTSSTPLLLNTSMTTTN